MPTSGSFTPVEGGEGGGSRRCINKLCMVVVGVVVVLVVVVVVVAVVMVLASTVRPGMTVVTGDKLEFRSDQRQNEYTKMLDEFVRVYDQIEEDFHDQIAECQPTSRPSKDPDRICRFSIHWLTSSNSYCTKMENWGFDRSHPCIIIKPNKVPDWVPEVYESLEELPPTMPLMLKDNIQQLMEQQNRFPEMLWLWCSGEDHHPNHTYTGTFKMYPWPGFPLYYFPYKDNPAYVQPLVGLEIHGLRSRSTVTVECRLWAKNLDPEDTITTIQITMD